MVDFELLAKLRAAGVKRAVLDGNNHVGEVEFFEQAPMLVEPGRFDADTLVPPPSAEPEEIEGRPVNVPPALAHFLQKASIS